MKNLSKQIDRKILKTLEPLNKLNPILLDELAAKSIIEEVPADRIICRHGDNDSRQIYLLAGQIEVSTAGETKTKVIKSKSALKTPLAEGSPRTVTLKTKIASTLLYIDADLLELLMSDEPQLATSYEVNEIDADDSDDWMLTFLQSPAFLQLPTENIQKLLTHLEEIPVKKEQVVISQGDSDDNYYIIKSGTCNVHRKPYETAANVLLAVLPTGSGFGEEALISNGSRNATITMREDGKLMRLKKKDFLSLLINPLIRYYKYSETQDKLNQGCVVIDVRSEQKSKQNPLKDAVNIPLSMLRIEFDNLNSEREYLLVCEDGSQSAAAAFLMIQNGLKCTVLKDGLNSAEVATPKPAAVKKPAPQKTVTSTDISTKAKEQADAAKKQTEQIAAQQKEIIAARKKAEEDIAKHKKELAESRARIAQKNNQLSSIETEAEQLKEKAKEELAKAQAETAAIELRKKETNETIMRAEEIVKQSAVAAEKTRKQAEEEAVLIKQRAIEETERLRAEKAEAELAKAQAEKAAELIKQRAIEETELLRAEKAAQELAKAQAESEAIELRQQETNKAMLEAEEIIKQSALAAKQAKKQAEKEAALIKQRALEEVEYLRTEVEAAQHKMEQDSAQLKKEEDLIKQSALKLKKEADEIRRNALTDAEQVRTEIEATRSLLNEKLQQSEDEEKRRHDTILAEAQKDADKLAAIKTQKAAIEAEAIRQKAQEEAERLHNELLETRKEIEAEAARVINELKEQSKKAAQANEQIPAIGDEVLIEIVDDVIPVENDTSYKNISIPGISTIEPINDAEAKLKAEVIKEKLAQSQVNRIAQQTANNASAKVKVHKTNERTILEGEEDLFIFQEPKTVAKSVETNTVQPAVSLRTRAETELTQISIEPQKSVVIFPQQEQETAFKNNMFLNQDQEQPHTSTSYNTQQFDKQAYLKQHQSSKSNTFAIAASFLLIIAGAIFTLHATNTLKVQAIATLFNSGNDTVQTTTAVAKTKSIRKKVLRADTKVNVKKKVNNKMDDIMQGWKDVLSESSNPKKLKTNQ